MLAIFAFSLFISAVTMCVTSFAKSYKEANNYITPLMLVVHQCQRYKKQDQLGAEHARQPIFHLQQTARIQNQQ